MNKNKNRTAKNCRINALIVPRKFFFFFDNVHVNNVCMHKTDIFIK